MPPVAQAAEPDHVDAILNTIDATLSGVQSVLDIARQIRYDHLHFDHRDFVQSPAEGEPPPSSPTLGPLLHRR